MFSMSLKRGEPPEWQRWHRLMPVETNLETGEDSWEEEDFTAHIESLLMKACDDLGEAENAVFRVSGFGEPEWKVDVSCDFSTIVDQLPTLRRWLARKSLAEHKLSFFEQGVQRVLHMRKEGRNVRIRCESWLESWQPDPEEEVISQSALGRMLLEILTSFIDLVKEDSPIVYSHPLFARWVNDLKLPNGETTGLAEASP